MKYIYIKVCLLALVIISVGCDNEELKTSDFEENKIAAEEQNLVSDSKIIVKNEMLSFATREDYDLTIDNLVNLGDENFEDWEKEVGFTSMRSSLSTEELSKRKIEDPLLATIINPSGMIEIAGNIFKLDMLTETVTMIPSNEYTNKGFSSKSKRVFSTDDDILDILEGNEEASEAARRYCGSQLRTGSISVNGSRTSYFLEYRRAGFLNTLRAVGFNKYNVSIIMTTKGITFYKSKSRCINEIGRGSTGSGATQTLRIYSSSRRLKSYGLDVEILALGNNNSLAVKRDKISCGTQRLCN